MCELLTMSARVPASVSFSLEEFARRGGITGSHTDGWGIAYFEGRDARIMREPLPAATSSCIEFMESHPIRSSVVLSHIRKATRGNVGLENTQPFARELGGRLHVFAHNGDLDLAPCDAATDFPCGGFRPIGDTDSERAFCSLLARMETLWAGNHSPPNPQERLDVVVDFAGDLRTRGIANFLYTDGEMLFAHGHRRHQSDGGIRPPGLHFLCRTCKNEPSAEFESAGFRLTSDEPNQSVVLITSVPLTDEGWEPLEEGEVLMCTGGEIVSRMSASAS